MHDLDRYAIAVSVSRRVHGANGACAQYAFDPPFVAEQAPEVGVDPIVTGG
jgi:hypothetical protein